MNSVYRSEIKTIDRFYSHTLNNFRNLYIYLPPSYSLQPERHYPVLYMHDGQNIFSGITSYSGEGWEIHQVADELIAKQQIEEIIIVGIAHQNDQRLSEYAHNDGSFEGHHVKGKGLLYEAFLIEDVKPFIESNFRILSGPENTALMGSSMGGLVTFNIGLRHPEIFGKLGVLSPSFWWGGDTTVKQVKKMKDNELPRRMWIDIGDGEGDFSNGFNEVIQNLRKKDLKTPDEMAFWLVSGGIHSEIDWKRRVHCPLLYFFGDIGFPERMELQGRDLVGVEGDPYSIVPMVVYSSGFCITPYPVLFTTSDPKVITVHSDCLLNAHNMGETDVLASWENLRVSRRYAVTEYLSKEVQITLTVSVPTPRESESVFIGVFEPTDYRLDETENGFTAHLTLKRDSILSFKFTLGSWDSVEKDSFGNDIPSRQLIASEDATMHFIVESW